MTSPTTRCRALHVEFEVTGALPPRWEQALAPLASDRTGPAAAPRFVLGDGELTGPLGPVRGDQHELLSSLFDWVRIAARGALPEVVIHAGAVRRGDRVLLLPGVSGVGKSTLVANLVRDGWALLSDELVGIAPDGRLLPCPLPLRLDRDSCAVAGVPFTGARAKAEIPVAVLGGRAAPEAVRVTDVVLLERGDGSAAVGQVSAVPRALVVAVLADSVFAGADPARALLSLDAATTGARPWRLTSSEPLAARDALLAGLTPS